MARGRLQSLRLSAAAMSALAASCCFPIPKACAAGSPPSATSTSTSQSSHPQSTQDLKLLQAHVFFRHGDRSPVPFRGMEEENQHAAVWATRVQELPPNIAARKHTRGSQFPFGLLTRKGAEQATALGRKLQVLYGHLLTASADYSGTAPLFVRSTDYSRTHLSGHYVLTGLLGTEEAAAQVPVTILPPEDENLYSNERCTRLQQLWAQRWRRVIKGQGVSEHASQEWQEHLANLKEAVTKKFGFGPGKRFPWVAAMDQVYTAQAHGDPLPEGVDEKDVTAVRQYLGLAVSLAYRNQELCQLAVGPLFREVVGMMQQRLQGREGSTPRLLLYSGHDVTLQPIAACLGVPLATWPEYSAYLAFELWATLDESSHFVRLVSDGREVRLPTSAPLDRDSWPTKLEAGEQRLALTSWDSFQQLAGWSLISKEDHERGCQSSL